MRNFSPSPIDDRFQSKMNNLLFSLFSAGDFLWKYMAEYIRGLKRKRDENERTIRDETAEGFCSSSLIKTEGPESLANESNGPKEIQTESLQDQVDTIGLSSRESLLSCNALQ